VGEGEVLVRVPAVGVCAGDAKCFAGAPYFWGAGEKYGLEVGDHAISENIVPCWECRYCKRGDYHLCISFNIYGFKQYCQGAMATYMKYRKGAINHKVPKSIPAWQAAFIEPLACSVHAVGLGCVGFRDCVVVAGCGPLGLGTVAAARLKNPASLIALDLLDWKLEVARRWGANVVLNPAQCNVVEEVRALTGGHGCDIYIEATGHPLSVKQGLEMLRSEGRFVEYGVFGSNTSLDWSVITVKELSIKGGVLSPGCYPKAISMLESNCLPMKEIVTHQLSLDQAEEGIKLVLDGKTSLKVVIIP
jgi:threonine dehydrogenase-like Zn-dependent dehydrogenase